MRRLGCIVVAGLVAACLPAAARAETAGVRRVTAGTAWTPERGEFSVGVLGPIHYGILDELSISTHPILHLLLTPNACLKWKAFDGEVAVSLSASYLQTFLAQDRFPGVFAVYPTLTVPILRRAAISVQAGYVLDLAPIGHGTTFGGSVAVMLTDADLLRASVQEEWYRSGGFARPTGMLVYTRYFYQMRLDVGIAAGRFPLQVGTSTANIKEIPVFPVIDVWWVL